MRHFPETAAIAAHPLGVCKAAITAALVAPAGLAHAGLARRLWAVAVAVDLTTVATAANDDLGPAAGAHKESA